MTGLPTTRGAPASVRNVEIQPLKHRTEIFSECYETFIFPYNRALPRLSLFNLEPLGGAAVRQLFAENCIDPITPVIDRLGVLFEFSRIKTTPHLVFDGIGSLNFFSNGGVQSFYLGLNPLALISLVSLHGSHRRQFFAEPLLFSLRQYLLRP